MESEAQHPYAQPGIVVFLCSPVVVQPQFCRLLICSGIPASLEVRFEPIAVVSCQDSGDWSCLAFCAFDLVGLYSSFTWLFVVALNSWISPWLAESWMHLRWWPLVFVTTLWWST